MSANFCAYDRKKFKLSFGLSGQFCTMATELTRSELDTHYPLLLGEYGAFGLPFILARRIVDGRCGSPAGVHTIGTLQAEPLRVKIEMNKLQGRLLVKSRRRCSLTVSRTVRSGHQLEGNLVMRYQFRTAVN